MVWKVGGNLSTRSKPTHIWREHANFIEETSIKPILFLM